MLNPTTDIEWMDGFLRKELSESEIVAFQQRLAEEPAFAALFEEQQLIITGIRLNGLNKKVRHFQELGKSLEEGGLEEATIGQAVRYERNMDVLERFKERGRELDEVIEMPIKRKWNWQLAASILLPIGLFFSFWSNHSANQLAQENYANFPIAGTMGNISTEEGFLLYKEGKYEESMIALDKINPNNNHYLEAQAIQGEILFQHQQKYQPAFQKFNSILAQNKLLEKQNQDFRERLEWNIVLTAQKTGKIPNDLWNRILMNPKHKFHQNAIALNQEITFYKYVKWGAWLGIIIGIIALIFWFSSRRNKLPT